MGTARIRIGTAVNVDDHIAHSLWYRMAALQKVGLAASQGKAAASEVAAD